MNDPFLQQKWQLIKTVDKKQGLTVHLAIIFFLFWNHAEVGLHVNKPVYMSSHMVQMTKTQI